MVYGTAIGAVLIATLIRWALGAYVHDRIPFTTYYPSIVVATLLGGFWLGSLASVLSGFLAWWSFMPPPFGFSFYGAQVTSLLAFLLVCAVAALNSAVDMTDIAQIWHGYSDPATKMFRVNGKPTIGIGEHAVGRQQPHLRRRSAPGGRAPDAAPAGPGST